MAQEQTKLNRFAGPSMIHEVDHTSGIPQVQDQNKDNRQAQQGQSGTNGTNGRRSFEYQNPRQYS